MSLFPLFTRRALSRLAPLSALALLGGCQMVVLDPAGDVARQQGNLVMASTGLMLLIIVPVMALTLLFAWRYRASNKEATYTPDWNHSTSLELVIWAAPLMIVICLGALTWVGTHLLDPYRPLSRTAPGKLVAASVKPLEVDVVALDWKWLFIYPEQGVATVNELVAPIGRPVSFRISASSVMNSFYVPALAGQIYAMPGMETRLHAVFDKPGNFTGFSANYSGAGFSHMRFAARSLSNADFAAWVNTARAGGVKLDRTAYQKLEKPSERDPVQRFATVDPGLFDAIVNLCVDPGKMCMHQMMAIDAQGGLSAERAPGVKALEYDKSGARGTVQPDSTALKGPAAQSTPPMQPMQPMHMSMGAGSSAMSAAMSSMHHAAPAPVDQAPLRGAGLPQPNGTPSSIASSTAPVRPRPLS